jgi:cyclopropane fatty-acyl-phospholipid synthase-like methyltransferase
MVLSEKAERNLDENRRRWGERASWEGDLQYGLKWSDQTHCRVVADAYLHPFLPKRAVGDDETAGEAFDVLEIAPGAGRFSLELLRIARSLTFVDLSAACIELCRQRFRSLPNARFFVNDGSSLGMLEDEAFDLIASWDSFVHIDREVIALYVEQFPAKLRRGGLAWIHHAAHGRTEEGWRSDMTAALMREYAERNGLLVRAQIFRSLVREPAARYDDCVSILVRP